MEPRGLCVLRLSEYPQGEWRADSRVLYEHSQDLYNIAAYDLIQTPTLVCDLHTVFVYVQKVSLLKTFM